MTIDIRNVRVTGSTNDDVAKLARQGAAEGLWLRAELQTAGRGRQERAWASLAGNLFASTLVRLAPTDPAAVGLALVAAVAVEEVASAYAGRPTMIKWPNDVLLDGAKLAGILLERSGNAVVIGFGVNLADHPDDPQRRATDIAAITGQAPLPETFLADLAAGFARWLARWRGEGLAPVRARWLERAHPIGTALDLRSAGGREYGLFDGLDADGALRLRLADGSCRVIHAGDVFLI